MVLVLVSKFLEVFAISFDNELSIKSYVKTLLSWYPLVKAYPKGLFPSPSKVGGNMRFHPRCNLANL